MKKILFILGLFMLAGLKLFAQDDEQGNEKIRDKMNQYIQERLNLSRAEAERFSPVFLRYFKEWRRTMLDTKGGPTLLRQQKIVDLRLRYKNEFKDIVGEKKSIEVFDHQDRFIREIKIIRQERLKSNEPARPRKFRD